MEARSTSLAEQGRVQPALLLVILVQRAVIDFDPMTPIEEPDEVDTSVVYEGFHESSTSTWQIDESAGMHRGMIYSSSH